MRIRASAPGRCGIIGNPSDIYGGFLVSCSVPVRARCVLTDDLEGPWPDDLRLWDAATTRFPVSGLRPIWSTDIPRSSGISGSTALLASTLACVMQACDRSPDFGSAAGLIEFAELLRDVELRDARITCGYQDAYMITHGGLRTLDFAGKHPVDGGPSGTVTSLETPLPFLLITTGVERLSGSVHRPMVERWLEGEPEIVGKMKRVAELGRLGADALVKGDLAQLGLLMGENQAITASLGGSGAEVDRLVSCAKQAGALGAKLAGAGMGGTVIALTEDPDALEAALRVEGYNRFIRPAPVAGVQFENP